MIYKRAFSTQHPILHTGASILEKESISQAKPSSLFKEYSHIISPFYTPLQHDLLQFIYKRKPKSLLDSGPYFNKLVENKDADGNLTWKTEKYSLITDVTPGSTEWLFNWREYLNNFNSLELQITKPLNEIPTAETFFKNENNELILSNKYTAEELINQVGMIAESDSLLFKHQIILFMIQNKQFFQNNYLAIFQTHLNYMENEVNDVKEGNTILFEFFKAIYVYNIKLTSESSNVIVNMIDKFIQQHTVQAFNSNTLVGLMNFYISMGNIEQARLCLTLLMGQGLAPEAETLSFYIDIVNDPIHLTGIGSILKKVSNSEIFGKLLPYIDHFKKLQFLVKSNEKNLENYGICVMSFNKLIDMQFQYESQLKKYQGDKSLQKSDPQGYAFLLSEASLLRFNRKITNLYNVFNKELFVHPKVLVKVIKTYYKAGNYYMLNKLSKDINLTPVNLIELCATKQSSDPDLQFVSGIHKESFFENVVAPVFLRASDAERNTIAKNVEKFGNSPTNEMFKKLVQSRST